MSANKEHVHGEFNIRPCSSLCMGLGLPHGDLDPYFNLLQYDKAKGKDILTGLMIILF